MWKYLLVTFLFTVAAQNDIPEYIKQCRRSDPQLVKCITGSFHHLRPYLAAGIPEIEMPSVEPFIMDQLSLQLTGGPQGYRITLKNMEIFGASNYTVKHLKLSEENKPFEARILLPKLNIHAKYTSSGVLIIIPASGNGDFTSTLEGVTADVKGSVSNSKRPTGLTHMHVDSLDLLLNIKKVRMAVSGIFNNNRILTQATNLFLQENGHEVLKAMQPQLQTKLAIEFAKIANQLLEHVSVDTFLVD